MIRTLTLLLALAGSLAAQDLTPKAEPQRTPIAIVDATIHPISSERIEKGTIIFADGRITTIGAGNVAIPAGAEVIDAKGMHVYPGLISSYTQLGLSEIGAVRASRDFNEAGAITPEVRAAVAVNPDSTLLPVTRANGILTFAAFPRGGTIPGRASLMRMDGWTWEDMAIRADMGLVVNWPRTRARAGRFGRRVAPTSPHARTVKRIADAFAEARAYLRWYDKTKMPRKVDLRWEAFRRVFSGDRPVFFRANSYAQITEAVAFARKEKVRAVIVGGQDASLCTGLLVESKVGVILENIHRFPKRSDSDIDEMYRVPFQLEQAGVLWSLASGDRTANERNLPYAAARAVAYGLPRDAALRAITLNPARILGVGKELGSLETGKRATLIVTDGDPLQIPTNTKMAFLDGRKVDLSNKQKVLYEKYKRKYRK